MTRQPPAAADLLAWLEGHQDAMADMVAQLARLESPSQVAASQVPVLDRLERELAALGMRVRRLGGRGGSAGGRSRGGGARDQSGGQLLAVTRRRDERRGDPRARCDRDDGHVRGDGGGRNERTERYERGDRRRTERGERRPVQMLLGHCDTVWPLGTLARMPVERRGGRLYGPGVYDMKAGLVQAVFALRALAEMGAEPPADPVVFVNSDEEIGTPWSLRHVRRLARAARRVFVLEPSLGDAGRLKTRRKGFGRFTVSIHGRAAHAGLEPERGASAILELSHVIQRLYALAEPARGMTVNVGVVRGGVNRNVVAPEACAEVEVRLLHHEDAAAVEAALRAMTATVPGTRLEVTGAVECPPLVPTAANRRLWEEAAAAAQALGLELDQGTAGGASDGNHTSQHTATLDGLGAVGGGAHAADEHVEIARLPERAALLAMLLMAPLGPPEHRPPAVPPAPPAPPARQEEGER